MDSCASELYSSTNQTSTLTQVVLDKQHFAHRDYGMAYSHPAPCLTPYYGMPSTTQHNLDGVPEPFSQYLRSARSIWCGPCVTPQLLETNSNHPDVSPLSSFPDAGPGTSASELEPFLQDNQHTQNSTTSSDAHFHALHNNAATTFQTPGPSRQVDSPKRKRTKIYRDDGVSAMLQLPKATRSLKGGKRGKKTGKLQLKCGLCPNFFAASKGDLKRHLESLAHKKPSYICERCGGKFTREDALKRHRLHACPASSKKTKKRIGGK